MSLFSSTLYSHNLVETGITFCIFVSFFFFFLFHGVCSGNTQDHKAVNPLLPEDLWSRKEMVEMAGYGEETLSSVIVTGSLLCGGCSPGDHRPLSWPIAGASVAVKCHTGGERRSGFTKAVTDEYGEFIINLPSHLHAIPNLEKKCLVKVLHVAKNSNCHPAYAKKQRGLRLSSFGNGIRTYTAGSIRFQHFTGKSSQASIKKSST